MIANKPSIRVFGDIQPEQMRLYYAWVLIYRVHIDDVFGSGFYIHPEQFWKKGDSYA